MGQSGTRLWTQPQRRSRGAPLPLRNMHMNGQIIKRVIGTTFWICMQHRLCCKVMCIVSRASRVEQPEIAGFSVLSVGQLVSPSVGMYALLPYQQGHNHQKHSRQELIFSNMTTPSYPRSKGPVGLWPTLSALARDLCSGGGSLRAALGGNRPSDHPTARARSYSCSVPQHRSGRGHWQWACGVSARGRWRLWPVWDF